MNPLERHFRIPTCLLPLSTVDPTISNSLRSQGNSVSMISDHVEGAFENCFRGKLERRFSFNSIQESQTGVKGLYKDYQLYKSLMLLSLKVMFSKPNSSPTKLIRSTGGEAGLQERKC